MEAKWPFLVLLLFLTALTGYIISQVDRGRVMANWDTERCDLTIMLAARFFKPDGDPRTPSEFAGDNFDFCVKKHSDAFMKLLMAPLTALLGQQASAAGGAMAALQQVRTITQRLAAAFQEYIASFTKKLTGSMGELRRIFVYLRMAVQRMSAVAMSSIYMGMTLFSGMISSIQTFIRVILILCAIMIAVIILLWFILLPVIPFILSTLTAVVALVGVLSVVMSSSLSSQAESQKGGFCFAGTTPVTVQRGSDTLKIPLSSLQLGDRLAGATVTMIMEAEQPVEWYDLDGIQVAGDHRIETLSGAWCFVRDHPLARKVFKETQRVWCLNTSTHRVILQGRTCRHAFRDWEEMDTDDAEGQARWREGVARVLSSTELDHADHPYLPPMARVETPEGTKPLTDIQIGERVRSLGGWTTVLGVVQGLASGKAGGFTFEGGWCPTSWTDRIQASPAKEDFQASPAKEDKAKEDEDKGIQLITDSGEFGVRLWGEWRWVRDFTEVGWDRIHTLYPLISRPADSSPLIE